MDIKEGETDNVWIQFETGYRIDERKTRRVESNWHPYYQIGETAEGAKLIIRRIEKETETEMVLRNEGRE